jgi:hypothetical protein
MLEYKLVSRMLKETWIARNHQLFNAMSLCHREKWTGSSSHIQTCTGEREAQNETPFISYVLNRYVLNCTHLQKRS